jgi:hypothetical protein
MFILKRNPFRYDGAYILSYSPAGS